MVRSLVVALLVSAPLISAPAWAQDRPSTKWYASADFGTAKNGVSDYAFGVAVPPRDEKSAVFRVRVGYQFVRFFALEAGYADLGSYRTGIHMDCSSAPQVVCIPDFESQVDLSAFHFSGVGMVPIGDRLTVRAQVGFMAREKQTHQIPITGDDYRRSATDVLPTIGVGASFAIRPKVEVYAEWNKFVGDDPSYGGVQSAPGTVMDESDVEAFSIGARFRF